MVNLINFPIDGWFNVESRHTIFRLGAVGQ